MPQARRLQELDVKPVAVVRHDHGIPDEPRELLQRVNGAGSASDILVGDAGVVGNEPRYPLRGLAITEKRVAGNNVAVAKTRRCDLNDLAPIRVKPGCFQIEYHKRGHFGIGG